MSVELVKKTFEGKERPRCPVCGSIGRYSARKDVWVCFSCQAEYREKV